MSYHKARQKFNYKLGLFVHLYEQYKGGELSPDELTNYSELEAAFWYSHWQDLRSKMLKDQTRLDTTGSRRVEAEERRLADKIRQIVSMLSGEEERRWERISEAFETILTDLFSEYEPTDRQKQGIDTSERLSEDCLDKIREIANKRSSLGVNETFKKIFKAKERWIETVDGEKEEIKSWPTLRNRVRNYYPEFYDIAKKQ